MQTDQCEAILISETDHDPAEGALCHYGVGARCPCPGEPMAVDGALRVLCWTHRTVVKAGTYDLEFSAEPASVAAAE